MSSGHPIAMQPELHAWVSVSISESQLHLENEYSFCTSVLWLVRWMDQEHPKAQGGIIDLGDSQAPGEESKMDVDEGGLQTTEDVFEEVLI